MITIKQLHYFINVYESGSFQKAATNFWGTRQSYNTVIRELENELNQKLFIPNSSPIQLTPAGSFFYTEAKKIIATINKLSADTRSFSSISYSIDLYSGIISIIPELKLAVMDYIKNNLEHTITIDEIYIPDSTISRLSKNQTSCGFILTMAPTLPGFWSFGVKKYPVSCLMTSDHPLSTRTELSINDLLEYPIICYGSIETFYRPLFQAKNETLNPISCIIEPQAFKASQYILKNTEAIMLAIPLSETYRKYTNLREVPLIGENWHLLLVGKEHNDKSEYCKKFGEFLQNHESLK